MEFNTILDHIKAIFLDVDDTLLDFDKCAKASMFSAADEMGLTLPDNIVETFHRINDELWLDIQAGKLTTNGLYQIRWNKIFGALRYSADGIQFEKCFLKYLADSAEYVDGAIELLKYLRCGKYTICIASNAPYQQQLNRLQKAKIFPYVDKIFVSEQVGYAKPMKEFFDACFAELTGILSEETLMIGDSLSADINGAHNYGMKTCWFNKKHSLETTACADYVVETLRECIT